MKYLRSAKFGSKDIVIRKSEFVAKTQFLHPKPAKYRIMNEIETFLDELFTKVY